MRERVTDEALLPYAVTVARNLAVSDARRGATAKRNALRLVGTDEPVEGPEQVLLRADEERAVRAALQALPQRDREALVAHELHGVQTKAMAMTGSSTPGAVAAHLARARARMRVEYLLAFRRVDPPTPACRPVLLALSSGDQRRQRALDAGAHLTGCSTCAALSEPLLARKRAVAGVVPVSVGSWLLGLKSSVTSASSLTQVAAATAVTGVAVTGFVLAVPSSGPDPRPAPDPPPALVVGVGLPAVSQADLVDAVRSGAPVAAENATVLAVPADEGFWLGNGAGRVWVQLSDEGESSSDISAGQRVSFRAQPVAHALGFARSVGVTGAEGARGLDRQPIHLRVQAVSVTGF